MVSFIKYELLGHEVRIQMSLKDNSFYQVLALYWMKNGSAKMTWQEKATKIDEKKIVQNIYKKTI